MTDGSRLGARIVVTIIGAAAEVTNPSRLENLFQFQRYLRS